MSTARRIILTLAIFTAAAAPGAAQDDAAVAAERKAFIEALNALEFTPMAAKVDGVPVREAMEFIAKAAGVKIGISEDAAEVLDEQREESAAIVALRDKLRFAREEIDWKGVHARNAINDLARRHGFQVEFDPSAFETVDGAVAPNLWQDLKRKLDFQSVSLNRTGADLATVLKDIAADGGVEITIARDVPSGLRTSKFDVLTSRKSLWDAVLFVSGTWGLNLGYQNGKLVLTTKEVIPPPWVEFRGFWITWSGACSAEEALRRAMESSSPRLSMRRSDGKWIVSRSDQASLPWDPEIAGTVNIDESSPCLQVLENLLEGFDLSLGFADGKPTVMTRDAARESVPRPEITYSISYLKGSYENFPGNFPEHPRGGYEEPLPPMYDEEYRETYDAMSMRESVAEEARLLAESGFGDADQNEVVLSGGRLRVKATWDVHENIEKLIDGVRRAYRRAVKIDFHFMEIESSLMNRLVDSGGLSWGAISGGQSEMIDAAFKSGSARSVKRASIIAFNGQTVNASAIRQKTYVRDYDVEVAQGAQIGDPIVGVLREGMVAEAVPVVFGDGKWMLLNLRTAVSNVIEPTGVFSTPCGDITLPQIDFQRISTALFVKNGGTVLLGGTGSTGVGKNLVLMIQVNVVDEHQPEAPRGLYGREIKVWDIRDLTYRVSDYSGPDVGITSASSGAAMAPGFCEPDDTKAGENYEPDEVMQLIRERIDPESWDTRGCSINFVIGYVVAVNTRQNIARVETLLESMRTRRMKGVEIVTRFLSVDSDKVAEIMNEEIAAKGSAVLSADQIRKILALAEKDDKAGLSSTTFTLLNKQRASMQTGRNIPYVGDVDVEVAQMAAIGDPVSGHLLEGVFLDYQAEIDPGEEDVNLVIRPTLSKLRDMKIVDVGGRGNSVNKEGEDEGKSGKGGNDDPSKVVAGLGRVMLPDLDVQKIRTTLTLPGGSTALVYCPADSSDKSKKSLVILVTVRAAGPDK